MIAEPKIIATLKAMPDFAAAQQRAADLEIEARKQHIAAIAKLDAEALKAYPSQEKRKQAAADKARAAERELQAAYAENNAVALAVTNERREREVARNEHERALLQGDWSTIEAFISEARDEQERTRRQVMAFERSVKNPITGRTVRNSLSNFASVNARAQAILDSIRAAPDLRLIADFSEIPARLAQMKASWPEIKDAADF